ncbi:hypothetical protein CBI38_28470 [Rhodococcus oxybenzonivorans]|uniref:Uncharacterized protein n=1 Tax=Rhodococcus oxybenzonivorans TaxID=1990687 RepID=A0A2S2C299_9NOCA|nr:hypothetical protein CBI38_28470 [Rhodococcus oxybenzonivorans]
MRHSVIVDAPPQRAVSLNQGSTEILLSLGLADRMAGTATWADPIRANPAEGERCCQARLQPAGHGELHGDRLVGGGRFGQLLDRLPGGQCRSRCSVSAAGGARMFTASAADLMDTSRSVRLRLALTTVNASRARSAGSCSR